MCAVVTVNKEKFKMKVNYELKETVKTEKQEYELSHKMDYTIHFL